MCDAEWKLIAWLDGELLPEEAAKVERHLEACKHCRHRRDTYEQMSKAFDACCEAVVTRDTPQRFPGQVLVLSGAFVATLLALLLFVRTRIEPGFVAPFIATASVPVVERVEPQMAPHKAVHHRRIRATPANLSTKKWQPAETAVQIAIPADAMFAPGALPQGMNFIAELRIAPDGSVEQVRLRQ